MFAAVFYVPIPISRNRYSSWAPSADGVSPCHLTVLSFGRTDTFLKCTLYIFFIYTQMIFQMTPQSWRYATEVDRFAEEFSNVIILLINVICILYKGSPDLGSRLSLFLLHTIPFVAQIQQVRIVLFSLVIKAKSTNTQRLIYE